MLSMMTTFEKFRQEHEVVQANTRLIAGAADNLLVLCNLQNNQPNLTSRQLSSLGNKRMNLKRAIIALKEGLIEHFNREEEALKPFVGILMHILKKEHQKVIAKLEEIDWMLLNISPAGILFNSTFLKNKIDTLCQSLDANCTREDSVLDLLINLSESNN